MQKIKVKIKYRLGLTEFSGYDLENEIEREIPDDEDPVVALDGLTQELHEMMRVYAEPYFPFLKLAYVDPQTKDPYPYVIKLYQGVPLLED